MLDSEEFLRSTKIVALLKQSNVRNWVNPASRNSITLFDLRTRGVRKVRDLDLVMIDRLRPIVTSDSIINALRRVIPIARTVEITEDDLRLYPIGKKLKKLELCSSKEIRESRQIRQQICSFKIGLDLTVAESKTWLHNVRMLTSVRHKNVLLRTAHGEIYSNERCHRHGLTDNPLCAECGQLETIEHKLFLCANKEALWRKIFEKTRSLVPGIDSEMNLIKAALCSFANCNPVALAIHAETLTQILGNRVMRNASEQSKLIVKSLCEKETKADIKNELREILDS
jgi:hypothetical protein